LGDRELSPPPHHPLQAKLPSTRRRCETVGTVLNSAAALTWGKGVEIWWKYEVGA
jgi:hypothetical protein